MYKTAILQSRESALTDLARSHREGKPLSIPALREELQSRGMNFSFHPAAYSSRMEDKGFLMTGTTGITVWTDSLQVEVSLVSTCGHRYVTRYLLDISEPDDAVRYVRDMDITGWSLQAFVCLLDHLKELRKSRKEEDRAEDWRRDKESKILSLQSSALEARLLAASSPLGVLSVASEKDSGVRLSTDLDGRRLCLRFTTGSNVPSSEELKSCLEGFGELVSLFGRMIVLGETPSRYDFPSVPECSLAEMHEGLVMLIGLEDNLPEGAEVIRERSFALLSLDVAGIPVTLKLPYAEMADMASSVSHVFHILDGIRKHLDIRCSIQLK